MSTAEFDWSGDSEEIVIAAQSAVAVYVNDRGEIVIRQAAEWNQDCDSTIFVRPQHARALADALHAAAKALLPEKVRQPSPKSSGAERQRRYRLRQRNGGDGDNHNAEPSPVTPLRPVTRVTPGDAEKGKEASFL